MSSDKSDQYFGNYIKVVEVMNKKNPPGQFNRTVRMNSHGRCFQTSIDMVELQSLHILDG